MFKKEKNGLDLGSLNKMIHIGKKIMYVFFVLCLLSLIFIIQKIGEELGMLSLIVNLIHVISPLFIGFFIAWFLEPFICKLHSTGVSRKISIVMIFFVFIFFLSFIIYLFVPNFISQLDEMIRVVPDLIESADDFIKGIFSNLEKLYKIDLSDVKNELYDTITDFFESFTVGLSKTIIGVIISFFNMSVNFFIGLIIAFYISFDYNNIRKNLMRIVPRRFSGDAVDLTDSLDSNLKQFVLGTFIDMIILFIFQSFMFFMIGLSAPLVFGLICAVTNIIPYVGPYIGGVPAVIMAFTIDTRVGVLSLIVVVLAQFLESYVLHPIIMSRSVKLHPVTIIVGLLLFGHFFGIIGMILSTPIISCMKVVFNFVETKLELYDKMSL